MNLRGANVRWRRLKHRMFKRFVRATLLAVGSRKRWALWALGWVATSAATAAAIHSEIPAAAEAGFSWVQFLGPFHMVILHYPIGLLSLAAFLEVWAWWRPEEHLRRIVGVVLGLGAGSAVVAASLGLLRAQGAEYDPGLLGEHQRLGLATAILSVVAWGLHYRYSGRNTSATFRYGYRGILALAFGCLLTTGHHGGSLTHGRTFLSEHAPALLRPLLGPLPTHSTSAVLVEIPIETKSSTSNGPSIIAHSDVPGNNGAETYPPVQAAFAAKCYGCHGPEKQKSRFRLDDRAIVLQGGKSGTPAVFPGDPFQSNLLRVCLLPRTHEEAMPPEGKEPLTPEEIFNVMKWIQAGAPWP